MENADLVMMEERTVRKIKRGDRDSSPDRPRVPPGHSESLLSELEPLELVLPDSELLLLLR